MASESAVHSSKYFRSFAERSWLERQWFRLSQRTITQFFRVWCRLRVAGEAHIPAQGGILLASNHISMFDTVLIPATVIKARGLQIVWAPAKEELFRVPVLRHILLSWGSFPVRRGQSDLRAMRRILSLLRTEKVMIFPEGTRSSDGRLGPGNRTVGKFIYHTRPVVIPTVIRGTDRILSKGARIPRFRQPVSVHYGPPLDLQRYYELPDSKQTSEAIIQEVMRAIAALQRASS